MDLIHKCASLSLSLFFFFTCSSVGLALAVLAFMGKKKRRSLGVFTHLHILTHTNISCVFIYPILDRSPEIS